MGNFRSASVRFFLPVFLIAFLLNQASAQNKYDSLLKNYNYAGSNENKISILHQLIPDILEDANEDVLRLIAQYDSLSGAINSDTLKSWANYYYGEYYYYSAHYLKALESYQKAGEGFKSSNDKHSYANCLHNIGLSHHMINNYNRALSNYQQAASLFDSLRLSDRLANAYQNIGIVYYDWGKYSLSLEYYKKALEINEQLDNKENLAALNQNIGVLHYSWNNYDDAIRYYQKSLENYEKLENKYGIAVSLNNIGLIYEEQENYTKAEQYYKKALVIFEEINATVMICHLNYNIGSVNLNLGRLERANSYLENSLRISQQHNLPDYISSNYEAMSRLYERKGMIAKAFNYYKEHSRLQDSIFNQTKLDEINDLEAQYQKMLKEKEIAALEKENAFIEREKTRQQSFKYVFIASSLLILIAALVILYLYNKQQKTNRALNKSIEQHRVTAKKLTHIRGDLEEIVEERTKEVNRANMMLREEIDKQQKVEKELRAAKEKAEESDRLKTNFLANISHEVRTPMNAIVGFSQMIQIEGISAAQRKKYGNAIVDGCDNLLHLIDTIIDYSSLQSGDLTLNNELCNPSEIISSLGVKYRKELETTGKADLIELNEEFADCKCCFTGDYDRLKQALSYLLGNAIKFTAEGSITFGYTFPSENRIQFFVRDTGIGIPHEKQDIIYDLFRQIEEGATKSYGGTGIGLSLAKVLVNKMRGDLWVESEPGKGSIFYISLPCSGKAKIKDIEQEIEEYSWQDRIILIAEDTENNFKVLQEAIKPTNATVYRAMNGQEAIDMVKEKAIDLILMDIQMPVMDGLTATRKIKTLFPDIPVIGQTAYSWIIDKTTCKEAGCNDALYKPLSMKSLLSTINAYFRKPTT